MKIEIKGVEFSNKGAELMLHSIVSALDNHFEHYELVLTPGHLSPYKKRAALGAWQKFSFRKAGIDWTPIGNRLPNAIVRLMRHFGIVVEKEIDLVLDASGFVYSDKWDAPKLQHAAEHLRRLDDKTRYIFLPQAFGPFNKSKSKALMSELIERSDLVVARDDESYRWLSELQNQGQTNRQKVLNYPDFTPLLDASNAPLPEDLPEQYVCIIPNSKMYPKGDNHKREAYLGFLEQAVLVVQALGLFAVVVNHEGEKDAKLCRDLVARLTIKPKFYDGLDVLSVKNVIGRSVFNVCSRFHGCVSGLSQGVPTLATSWSHKYEQLYRFYQCSEHVLAVDAEVGVLEQTMAMVLEQRSELSEQLNNRAQLHKSTCEQMWADVFARIK